MRLLRSAVLAIGLIAPACFSADPWRFVHPQSKMLAGIEWRRFAESPAGRELRKQSDIAGMGAVAGLNLFESVDRVLISSPGRESPTGKQEPPVVVAVTGRFDLARLRQALAAQGATARHCGAIEVLSPKKMGNSPIELALVDAQTLVFAEPAELQAALSRDSRPSSLGPLSQRAEALAARNDIWVVATVPAGQLADPANPQVKMLSEVTAVEAGASFRNGFGLLVNLTTSSEDAARSLAAGIQMLAGLALVQQAGQPQIAELGRKLRVVPSGPVVQVTLSLNQAELEQSFASLRQSFAQQKPTFTVRPVYRGDSSAALPPPPEPEKPPEKQVVRIYGLEEGAKEIPITKP